MATVDSSVPPSVGAPDKSAVVAAITAILRYWLAYCILEREETWMASKEALSSSPVLGVAIVIYVLAWCSIMVVLGACLAMCMLCLTYRWYVLLVWIMAKCAVYMGI
jgi:hypothetical protein